MRAIQKIFVVVVFALLLLWVFCPKPALLDDIDFSRAVYDANHRLLRLTLSKDEKYRLKTRLQNVAPELVAAILLKEDRYFYQHPGINPVSLVRAFLNTYLLRSSRGGGSTITMQVARLRHRIPSRRLFGKIKQMFFALALERHYTKQEILTAYLSLAPYGNNIESAGAASLILFDKEASRLNLPEALTLAVIPQNPVRFSSDLRQNPAFSRMDTARKNLLESWIQKHPEDKDRTKLFSLPSGVKSRQDLPFHAPHFVDWLLQNNPDQHSITSTLDLGLQKKLERHVKNLVAQNSPLGIKNAAALLVDFRKAQIKAMVGSADFFNEHIQGQVNGTTAKRSPGSALKPFVYALALDQGKIHPRSLLKDLPVSFGGYDPENHDHKYMGPLPAEEALILSRNIPAVNIAQTLSHPDFYDFLKEAKIKGLRDKKFYGLSTVLGGAEITMMEMASLYAALANQGIWRPITGIRKTALHTKEKKLFSPEAAFVTLNMLTKAPPPVTHAGFGRSSGDVPVAWKTGTSFSFRDAWTAGVVGPYVLVVWVGNFDGRSNPGLLGRHVAAPLFFSIVENLKPELLSHNVLKPLPSNNLSLKQVEVCALSGQIPGKSCPHKMWTWFIPGVSPIKNCDIHREVAINKLTGKRSCSLNDPDVIHRVYEFWPSDLMSQFKLAGIPRESPPPFENSCTMNTREGLGLAPQIFSPDEQVVYYLRSGSTRPEQIAFKAASDADSRTLFWFVGNEFVGQSRSEKTLFWAARTGDFTVKVVDENGRSASRDLSVKLVRTR